MTYKTTLFLVITVLFLTIFGLIMVGNASVVTAARDFNDKWYYLKLQATWMVLGLIGFLFFSKFPHRHLEKYASGFFLVTLFFLVAVLIPGIGLKLLGARRWINLGPFSFQPAEFAKLATAIYLAKLFKSKPSLTHLGVISGVLGFLIMLEPDMGTMIVVIGMCVFVYFGSGGRMAKLVSLLPLAGLLAVALIILSPYRLARLKSFIDVSHDPLGSSYQIRQSLIALGSGGLWGMGLGESRQKYQFLPEVTTDSIFAVVGEELGLIGAVVIVSAYLALTLTGLQLAKVTNAPFSRNLALAISVWFGLQAFINMSAIVALLPFTGIPLTFISYGGSSLFVALIASGILVNIAHAPQK